MTTVAVRRAVLGLRLTALLALLVLATVLVLSAWDARREATGLERRRATLDREVARAREENRSLREELRALREDPVYVESLLRGRLRAAPGERILAPTDRQ